MKILRIAAVISALALSTQASALTTIKINSYGFTHGKETGTLHYSPSSFNNRSLYVGEFHLTGTNVGTGKAVSFDTFCVDVGKALTVPTTYTIVPLSQLFSADKAKKLLTLATNVNPTNATQSAALQLAIWEVAFEKNNPFNVTNGAFSMSGGSSGAARTLANTYLASLPNWAPKKGFKADVLFSATSQSQMFIAAVPEPASWAMMIAGFGLTGAALRRRTRESVRVVYA